MSVRRWWRQNVMPSGQTDAVASVPLSKRFRRSAANFLRSVLGQATRYRSSGKWLLLSTVVGLVAGCGGIAFQIAEHAIYQTTAKDFAGFSPKDAAGEGRIAEQAESPLSPVKLLLVM